MRVTIPYQHLPHKTYGDEVHYYDGSKLVIIERVIPGRKVQSMKQNTWGKITKEEHCKLERREVIYAVDKYAQ